MSPSDYTREYKLSGYGSCLQACLEIPALGCLICLNNFGFRFTFSPYLFLPNLKGPSKPFTKTKEVLYFQELFPLPLFRTPDNSALQCHLQFWKECKPQLIRSNISEVCHCLFATIGTLSFSSHTSAHGPPDPFTIVDTKASTNMKHKSQFLLIRVDTFTQSDNV